MPPTLSAASASAVWRFLRDAPDSERSNKLTMASSSMTFIRASSLDDLEVFKPQMHVYASRAASWDKPGPDLTAFDIMPPGM